MKFFKLIPLILLSVLAFGQKTYTIKMATVAPEGSSWITEMRAFEKDIAELTDGQISFRIYANAVQGSEKDVLRKMKLGQIDAATFTGVGLGDIVPEVRILDLPFMFRSSEEVDYVYGNLFSEFQKKFEERGFYLVGWAEVGFIYLFTKKPVTNINDFKNIKMWLWKGDPLAKTTFEVMNIPAIPLEITDVHMSLQTGMINGVYISPYGVLALQWFVRTNYILEYPLTNSVGAVLMTTKKLNTMPEDLRQILIDETKKSMRRIVVSSRKDNLESLTVLQETGLELVAPKDQAAVDEFNAAGVEVREKLVGELYSQELLDKVIRLLNEYRESHGS
ncbi:MAG: TRAP transporter substrate-binding protein DctP [Candidatus Marinimicrobia bacterium]|nr:TRAP transporter substrate-binding protein DctP [Candidatus Neomarinimicrobiota bacterium]